MKLTILEHCHIRMGFNDDTGLPVLLENTRTGTQFLKSIPQPFFKIWMQSPDGKKITYTALDAATANVSETADGLILRYNFIGMQALSVRCDITRNNTSGFDFAFKLRNVTASQLIELEYPLLQLEPVLETPQTDWIVYNHGIRHGMLIHGFENAFAPEDDQLQWQSSYIESVQMLACGDSRQTLYFATRDTQGHCKHLKPTWFGSCLELRNRHFVDETQTAVFVLPYPAELCVLNEPGWQEAALKYRTWTTAQWWCAKRLDEREDVPAWWLSSPIILSVKEQAKRNSDRMQRVSPWCHPLTKGVSRILEVANHLDSTINVQVFHWERDGAFVNIDHFPPLSGWDGTREFFNQLHQNGHYGGLYILPLRWCIKADTTGYDGSAFFEEQDALGLLALNEHRMPEKSPWDWDWRKRFCMCGAAEPVRHLIADSFHKVADLGADYIQFDTFNGMLYDCWSSEHGHHPGRGRWQIEESIRLIKECAASKKPFVMTCEAAPIAEMIPFMHGYVERGLQEQGEHGREYIPLFQFLYHPYCQGFSGEECGAFSTIDQFFLVNAVTIINGEMLMINLDEEGKYAVMTHEPDDHTVTLEKGYPVELIESYIKRLNHLRRDLAGAFLTCGTMEKDPVIVCDTGKYMQDNCGDLIKVPAVIGRTWSVNGNIYGTVLINHTEKAQEVRVKLTYPAVAPSLFLDTDDVLPLVQDDNSFLAFKIPALTSAVVK